MNKAQAISSKKKLAQSLLARAREWENPRYLPFISSERRHAKVIVLRSQARQLLQSAKSMAHQRTPDQGQSISLWE